MANPEASLDKLSQTAATLGVEITPQGLDQRFTPEAAACLKQVLDGTIQTVVAAEPATIPVLNRFNGVFVQDSTTIVLPEVLEQIWPGCGGSGPVSAVKAQVRVELTTGRLEGPYLSHGRAADASST